jgi:hypothetical protein
MVIIIGQGYGDELTPIDHQPERWGHTVPTHDEQKWVTHVL